MRHGIEWWACFGEWLINEESKKDDIEKINREWALKKYEEFNKLWREGKINYKKLYPQ